MQVSTPHEVPSWRPRPYQARAVEQVVTALRTQALAGQPGRVMLAGPTGAGKTGTAVQIAQLVAHNGGKAVYVVPRADMLPQTWTEIRKVTHDVLLLTSPFSTMPATTPTVTLATSRTIQRRLRRWPNDAQPDLLIVDEAHLDPLQARTLADAFPGAALLGLTATPERQGDDVLLRLYRHVVQLATDGELVEEGYLVPCSVFASECPDVALLHAADGEFDPLSQEAAFTNPRIMGAVLDAMRTLAQGLQVVLFAASAQHAGALARMLQGGGVRAEALTERTSPGSRDSILTGLAAGRLRAVCVSGLPPEGMQLPNVGAIFIVHATQSLRRWRQEVGTCRLPSRHRPELMVVDFGDNWRRLGLPNADVAWTLRAQPTDLQLAAYLVCAGCGRVVTWNCERCPSCRGPLTEQPGDQPVDRPQLLVRLAERMRRRQLVYAHSVSVPIRPCPWRYGQVADVWAQAEQRRLRQGLILPCEIAPYGYAEWACEQALRRLRDGATKREVSGS